MKTITSLRLASFFVSVLMMASVSCKKPCKDVICDNNGTTREEGKECVCDCPDGFEGDRCETYSREKFRGIWIGSELCDQGGSTSYLLRVTNAAAANQIEISNLGDFGFDHTVIATVSGSDFLFEPQVTGGKTYEGSGKMEEGKFLLDYTISQGTVSYTCTGKFDFVEQQ